jgi:hypothetical protein
MILVFLYVLIGIGFGLAEQEKTHKRLKFLDKLDQIVCWPIALGKILYHEYSKRGF